MMASLVVPPWMMVTALVLAIVAGASLVFGWLRQRTNLPASDLQFSIQPLSAEFGSTPGSAKGSGLKLPKFMSPPGPLAPSPNDAQAEHRATFRRAGNSVLVLVADADDHHRPLNAWVIDRSRRGLRLAAESELSVGGIYTVRASQAPPATPWCAFEVRHCARTDGHWEIGCRFLQPPPVQILMLFG